MVRFSFLLLVATLLAGGAPARAEHGGDHDEDELERPQPEGKPDHGAKMLELMERRLKLTPEQRKRVEAAIKEGQPDHEKLQKEMEGLRERMKKLMLQQHERVRAVLDDEQKWKFDELTVQMRKRGQERRKRARPQGPRRMPGAPEEEEPREHGPRDLPPPEMWQDRPNRPRGGGGGDGDGPPSP